MKLELTLEDLDDLSMLCAREADTFDYDEEVRVRFTALNEKLLAMYGDKKEADKVTGGQNVQA